MVSPCLFIPARGVVYIFVLSDVVTFPAQTAGTAFVIIGGKWLPLGEKVCRLRLCGCEDCALTGRGPLVAARHLGSRAAARLLHPLHRSPRCLCQASVRVSFLPCPVDAC